MVPTRRRSLLAALGVAATVGCLGDDAEPPASGPNGTTGSTETDQQQPVAGHDRLRLAAGVDPRTTDGTVHVHPQTLRTLLVNGATRDSVVRGYDTALLQGQTPVLAGDTEVVLTGSAVESGSYTLSFEGGPRYEWKFGATEVSDPPADADVVDIESLSSERHSFVESAIHGTATAYPETPLGTWGRRTFIGGYVSHRDTVYRGREQRQTDAAFFADEVWYVGTVAPAADAESGTETRSETDTASTSESLPTFSLDPLPSGASRTVDDLLDTWAGTRDPVEADVGDLTEAERTALANTDIVLTHVAAFSVSLE